MASLPQVGQVFDAKYRIDAVLGSGGVATVFTAYQLEFDRLVALKLVHAHFSEDEEFKARFVREGQVLARLHHDNIVLTYNMGISTSGFPYIAMELVKGHSVRKVLNESERLPAADALKIIRDSALALAYVHEQGIIHRDLKPENMLLAEQPAPNTVKLIDFGLARTEVVGQQGLTRTGELLGTTDYMSPEQCSGQKLDKRSDIYSLALCLYELMTGNRPFTADTAVGTMYKQLNHPMPALQPEEIDVYHPLFNEIIQKGAAKRPDERFQSMDEFAAKLTEAIKKIDGMTVRMIKKSRRRPPSRMTVATIILSLIAVAAGVAIAVQRMETTKTSKQLKDALSKHKEEQVPNALDAKSLAELQSCENWLRDSLDSKSVQANQLARVYCDAFQAHILWSIPGAVPGRNQVITRLREHLKDRHLRANYEDLLHTQIYLARTLLLNGEIDSFAEMIRKIRSAENDVQLRNSELHVELSSLANLLAKTGQLELEDNLLAQSSIIVSKRHDLVQLVPELSSRVWINRLLGNEPIARTLAKEAETELETCLQEKQPLDFRIMLALVPMFAPIEEGKKTASFIDNFFPDENAVLEQLKQTDPKTNNDQVELAFINLKLELARCYRQQNNMGMAKKLLNHQLEERMLKLPDEFYDPSSSTLFISELIKQKPADLDDRLQWHLEQIRKKGPREYFDFSWATLSMLAETDSLHARLKKELIESFGLYESRNPALCGRMRTQFGKMLLYSDQAAVAHEQFQHALRDLKKDSAPSSWLLAASYGLVRSSIEMHNYTVAVEDMEGLNTKALLASANIKDASYDFCFKELQGRILFESGKQKEGLKIHEELRKEYKDCTLNAVENYDVFCQDLASEYLVRDDANSAKTVLQEGMQSLLKYRIEHPDEQLRLARFMRTYLKTKDPDFLRLCKKNEQEISRYQHCLEP